MPFSTIFFDAFFAGNESETRISYIYASKLGEIIVSGGDQNLACSMRSAVHFVP